MFELDFRNSIVLVSLAIHALLFWILYRYGRKTPGGLAYVIAILTIAGWVFPMLLYRLHLFGETVLWARLLYVMASFTSISFFYFTLVFPDNRRVPVWVDVLLTIETVFVIALCLHPTLMIQGVDIKTYQEDVIRWGPLYVVYVLHISGWFFAGFVVLLKKMWRASGGIKKQIFAILVGYFIASNLAMTTNLILPWFGYFELNWLGQFFSTLVAAFTTYAILRHQLLNIKLIATEGFLLLLNLFVFFQVALSKTFGRFSMNLLLFFAVFGVSFLLIRSVRKEIAQREAVMRLARSLELANENLKKANEKLKELDELKTEFLSIASHQLRTPLSIIKGYTSLMEEGAYGKVSTKALPILHNIDVSNERLIKLVDEFLNVSRIEQGRTQYRMAPFVLADVAGSVITELTEKAHGKNVRLVYENRLPTEYTAQGDEDKIRHAMYNFVDNAIKYSPEKEVVQVVLGSQKNGVEFRVVDHGVGLDKKDIKNLFQKFYRSPHVMRDFQGTGLGLFVVREFIEGHAGRVWAKSNGVGKGSEFGFWVPKEQRAKK